MPRCAKPPTLEELATWAASLPQDDNFSARLADRLRGVLRRIQRDEPQPFYSLRELACAFRLHHSTVADVYARLESEGLLVRVRGSGTLVPARRPVSQHQVVAVPVWLPGFRWIPEWRVFLMTLQEELSRHGAVADFIFYRQGEEVKPQFVTRVKAHRPDRLFWLEPHPVEDRQPLLRLVDAGLTPVTVTDRPMKLPGFGYWKDRQRAFEQGFHDWQAAGIKRVLVVTTDGRYTDTHLRDALRVTRMPVRFVVQPSSELADFLTQLVQPDSGVVWDDPLLQLHVAIRAPREMQELYRRTRVLLTRSRLLWTDTPEDIRVDVLDWDCQAVAQRVARDLISGEILCNPQRPVFALEWRPRVTARDVLTDGEGL